MYDGISYLFRVMGPRIDVDVFICDSFFEINAADTNYGTNRSADDISPLAGSPKLTFDSAGFFGGDNVSATRNIQYDAIIPNYDLFTVYFNFATSIILVLIQESLLLMNVCIDCFKKVSWILSYSYF